MGEKNCHVFTEHDPYLDGEAVNPNLALQVGIVQALDRSTFHHEATRVRF